MTLRLGYLAGGFLSASMAVQPAAAQTFGASIAKWFGFTENVMSAIKVDTKQMSVAAQQTSTATMSSMKALADTITTYETTLAYNKALNSSAGVLTSAGELCSAVDVASSTAKAGSVADIVRAGVASTEENWRKTGGSLAEQLSMQLQLRQQVYCSAAEFDAGLCGSGSKNTAAEAPAADSNAAEWMLVRSYGSTTALNGVNYIDTAAPLPSMFAPDEAKSDVDKGLRNLAATESIARLSVARGLMADVLARGVEGGE